MIIVMTLRALWCHSWSSCGRTCARQQPCRDLRNLRRTSLLGCSYTTFSRRWCFTRIIGLRAWLVAPGAILLIFLCLRLSLLLFLWMLGLPSRCPCRRPLGIGSGWGGHGGHRCAWDRVRWRVVQQRESRGGMVIGSSTSGTVHSLCRHAITFQYPRSNRCPGCVALLTTVWPIDSGYGGCSFRRLDDVVGLGRA